MNDTVISIVLTCVTAIITGYFTYKVTIFQYQQNTKNASDIDETTGEIEFRKSLLSLLDQQEEKLKRHDERMERFNAINDANQNLINDLKRANLDLAIENRRSKQRISDLESEVERLKQLLQGDSK